MRIWRRTPAQPDLWRRSRRAPLTLWEVWQIFVQVEALLCCRVLEPQELLGVHALQASQVEVLPVVPVVEQPGVLAREERVKVLFVSIAARAAGS